MSDTSINAEMEARRVSRREFIKRVIASGAVASSASFVMGGLAGCSPRPGTVAGSVERDDAAVVATVGHQHPVVVAYAGCNAADTGFHLIHVEGRAVAPHLVQLALEQRQADDRVRRCRGQARALGVFAHLLQ